MKFNQLFKESMELWPSEIGISDGIILDNGILFSNLSTIWNNVERKAKLKNDWFDLMAWIIFANLHSIAVYEFQAGKNTVSTNQIDKENVKSKLFENLQEKGYEDMLSEFKQDNLLLP